MTSRNSKLPTHARVYIDGGPVVHLTGRPTVLPTDVRQSQDELRAEIKSVLHMGEPIEGLTTDGDWVHIPAARVVDVVYPALDPERIQGPESGMGEDERRAEAWLDQHGDVAKAVDLADRAFVEQYMADRTFGSEVVVLYAGPDVGDHPGKASIGIVSGYDHNDEVFLVDRTFVWDPAGERSVGEDRVRAGLLEAVLCWNLEDYAVTGDSTQGQFTSKGLDTGPGTVLGLVGRDPGGTASEPLSGGMARASAKASARWEDTHRAS